MSTLSTFWSTLLFIAGGVSIAIAAYGLFREKTDTHAMLRLMCLGDFGCILLGCAGSAQAETGALLTLVYTGTARLLAWFALSRLAERAGGGGHAGLRGVGRAEPVTAAMFAFAMFAAIGISFFFTPDARLILLHASMADGGIIMPALLLAATDGYANSFQDDGGFLKVGADLLDILNAAGATYLHTHLADWLTEASQAGSGDDITVGVLYHP